MVTTSAAYKTAIRGIGRQIWSRVVFPAIPFTASSQIINIEIESNLTGSDDFEIGTAYMSTANVVLQDNEWEDSYIPSNLTGTECTIQVGIDVSPGVEYISLGRFIVEKQTYNSGEVTLSLVDFMSKADVPFTAHLVYPVTILQILQAAASQVGLPLETTSFANSSYTVQNEIVFEGVTCRRIFSQVAELAGGYAVINRAGNLEILTLGKGSTSLDANEHVHELKKLETGTALFDKVIVKVGEEAASAGAGTNIYTVVDNMFVQNPSLVLNGIYGVLSGYTYTPIDLLDWIGDGSIELGDRVTISGDNTYLLRRKLNLSGGLSEVYRAPIKSNVERNSTGKTNTNLEINKLKTQIKIVSGEIDQVISDTDGNFTQINQAIDSISNRVGTAEGDVSTLQNTAQGLTNRISNAEGNISTLQNTTQGLTLDVAAADGKALNAQATADEVTLAFNTQKIGAGNLIKNGRGNFGVNSWQSGYPGTMFDSVTDAITRRDCGEGNIIRFGNSNADEKYIFQHGIPLKSGTTYTLNMLYWVGDRCKGMDVYIIGQKESAAPGTNPYDYIREVLKDTTYSDTAYEKLTYTFTTEADEDRCFLRIDNEGSTDGAMRYVYFMAWIEEGNRATPWKPNHDEIQALSHRFDATGYYMLDSNGSEIMSLSKGVANEQNIGRVDNTESGYPMKIPFNIGTEVSQITQAKLKWDISKFRTYSKGAKSGGGSTSGSGGSSTVSVRDWTQGLAASTNNATVTSSNLGQPHYHTVATANLGHRHDIPSHTHTTPNHAHDPEFGILEQDITDYVFAVYVDGVLRATLNAQRGEVDLSAWITTSGWHEITLQVNNLMRIDANLFLKTYIRR